MFLFSNKNSELENEPAKNGVICHRLLVKDNSIEKFIEESINEGLTTYESLDYDKKW